MRSGAIVQPGMTDGDEEVRSFPGAQFLGEDRAGPGSAPCPCRGSGSAAGAGSARYQDVFDQSATLTPWRSRTSEGLNTRLAAGLIVKVIADHRAAEACHGLLEPLRAIGRFPVARYKGIAAEGIERVENDFAFGPGRRAGALEFVAAVEEKAGPIAVRPLLLDRGLEAGKAAHDLDFGARARNIFRMGFELRMYVGEIKERDALAVLNEPGRLTGGRAGPQGGEAGRPRAAAFEQRDRRSRQHEGSAGRRRRHEPSIRFVDIAGRAGTASGQAVAPRDEFTPPH